MSTKEQILSNMKVLANRLAPLISFRYLVLEWDVRDKTKVIKIYKDEPRFIKFHAFFYGFGSKWEGREYPAQDNSLIIQAPVCTIQVSDLVGISFDGLSGEDDYSEFIVINGNEE